MRTVW